MVIYTSSFQAFQALSETKVLVLGSNGNLWLEHGPFGTVPPKRELIAGSVKAWQLGPLGDTAFVLGTDGNLWFADLLPAPGGRLLHVASNVSGFDWPNPNMALVLTADGNLWLEQGWSGGGFTSRQQVDGNVALSPR